MSLWGEEFEIKETPKQQKKILDKLKNPKNLNISVEKTIKSKSVSIIDKLPLIYREVYRILGKYKENTICIRDKEILRDYFDKAINNGVIAIDTETNNSLDPITCLLMGACIYTPGMKNAYIPMHHTDLNGSLLPKQLTESDFKEQLDRLSDVKVIMHNGKFDYEVIKCTCNKELSIYWDTMIGAKVLDENERAGLKEQYINKIDSSIEKYSIEHLFTIEYVDPDIFALYAATDAYMTYKLYEWQLSQFSMSCNRSLYDLFLNVEMPIVTITAEMELTGVCLDLEYTERLKEKYINKYNTILNNISKELHKYDDIISKWKLTLEANKKNGTKKSKAEQLENPINVSSSTQLAILLYDILNVPVVDKKTPRGTGEDILSKINIPLCNLILEQRGLLKLINTYIDALPKCVSIKDGRLHAHFNQYGAKTGRFSSSDPNLQNIPSHNNEIRMMFTASPGYVMIGSDFSQQEPRLLSHYSHDENMIKAYEDGKDLYAMIASKVYHNKYEDNQEFFSNGQLNPDGKKRRSSVKGLLLGKCKLCLDFK